MKFEAKTCLDAIQVLEGGGLCKFTQFNNKGEHCLIGAVMKVNKNWSAVEGALFKKWLNPLAEEMFPDRASYQDPVRPRSWSAVRFNNHPDTTLEDVVQLLEKAAIRIEEKVD